ncbi:GNAT family N-acetyltransferase [Niabella terrae]
MKPQPETIIRKITAAEVPLIHELALRIWPDTYASILSPEQLEYMLQMMYATPVLEREYRQGVEFYILSVEGRDQGYTAIEDQKDGSYKLHKIYLSQELRGQGLGKLQLRTMEDIVRKRGAKFMLLNVNRFNTAFGFYQRQGYGILRSEDVDIGQGYFMNDYLMQKFL